MFKVYYVSTGYFGWIGDRYILFSTIDEYYEYMEELINVSEKET